MTVLPVAHVVARHARRAALAVTASAIMSIASIEAQRVVDIDSAAVDRYVEAYVARTRLPGAIVAITRDGRVVYVHGYGTTSAGEPMTATTPVPIASLSKSFAATAVMQLVEAGKVALDAPVRRYLSDFVIADPRGERITVRQLLDHTSGMSDTRFREKSIGVPASLEAAVALLRPVVLEESPGDRMRYHNPNYWVAARLVEVVSGKPFAAYLHDHVFAPVGMRSSATVPHLDDAPNVARGHSRVFGMSVARREPRWYLEGSSGVVTTAADLARWLVAQQDSSLVSKAGMDTLHASHLGWADGQETGTYAHSGWLFTYTARQVLLPSSGYGLAVVANRGINAGPDDALEIMRGLVALVHGAEPTPPQPVGLIVDVGFALLTVVTITLAARAWRRSGEWAGRWQAGYRVGPALGVVVWMIPILLFVSLRSLVSALFGGRDGTWYQMTYVVPSLLVWLAVGTICAIVVVGRRVTSLRREGSVATR